MFESNIKESYWLADGSLVTDHFFGFKMVGDNVTVTQDSVVIGFNCGAPPEPAVSTVCGLVYTSGRGRGIVCTLCVQHTGLGQMSVSYPAVGQHWQLDTVDSAPCEDCMQWVHTQIV